MTADLYNSFNLNAPPPFDRADCERAVDRWIKYIAQQNDSDLALLSLAARSSLLKIYGKPSSPPSIFNGITGSIDEEAAEILEKLELVSEWLNAEQHRDAFWLSHCDDDGKPYTLLGGTLETIYKTAKKALPAKDGEVKFTNNSNDDPAKYLQIGTEDRRLWPLFFDETPEETFRKMTQGLPHGTIFSMRLCDSGPFFIAYENNEPGTKLDFTVGIDDRTTSGRGVNVTPKLQKHGISKTIYRHLYPLYQQMGIRHLKLFAARIGAYTWARAGFVPARHDWNNIKRVVQQRLDFVVQDLAEQGKPLPVSCIDELNHALSSRDPKNYWRIVDQQHGCYGMTLGKALAIPIDEMPREFPSVKARKHGLQNLVWDGSLDLNDAECRKRFEVYLAGGKKPAVAAQQKPATLKV